MGEPAFKFEEVEPGSESHLGDLGVQSFTEDLRQLPRAKANHRVVALLIDGLISGAVGGLVSVAAVKGLGIDPKSVLLGLYENVIVMLYFTFMQFNNGQTIGKRAMKIKTIDDRTGDAPSFGQALGRETIGRFLSIVPLGIGYMGASRREDAKTWHDRLFKTSVVDLRSHATPSNPPQT